MTRWASIQIEPSQLTPFKVRPVVYTWLWMGWRLGQVGAGTMTDHLNKVWNTLYRLYLPDITKEAVTCSQWYSFFQIVP